MSWKIARKIVNSFKSVCQGILNAGFDIGRLLVGCLLGVWEQTKNQNLDSIIGIWNNQYPPSDPKSHTLLEKVLTTVPLLIRSLSLSNVVGAFRSKKVKRNITDIYVMSWAIGLTVVLFTAKSALIFAGIAFYRVVDLTAYNLCVLLVDSQKPKWQPATFRRLVLNSFINIYEIIISFAVMYQIIGGVQNNGMPLTGALNAMYFSMVTTSTLGFGGFIPTTAESRMLVVAHLAFEFLFAFAIIPIYIGTLANKVGEGTLLGPDQK